MLSSVNKNLLGFCADCADVNADGDSMVEVSTVMGRIRLIVLSVGQQLVFVFLLLFCMILK